MRACLYVFVRACMRCYCSYGSITSRCPHLCFVSSSAANAAVAVAIAIAIPPQVILPDYLPGNPFSPLNQPVWCTYANGARSAIIVSESGTVFYQQSWLDSAALGDAIDAYWKQDGGGTWTGAPLEKGPLGPASRPTDKKAQKQQEKGPRAQVGKATP